MVIKKWWIVGFKHPDNSHIIVFKRNLTLLQLLEVIGRHSAECNLFSIRGIEVEKEK